MSFTRVNPATWSVGDILTSSQTNELDIDHANSLDKSTAGDAILGTITFSGSGNISANIAGSVKSTIAGGITTNTVGGIRPTVTGGIKANVLGGIAADVAGGIQSTTNGAIQLAGGSGDWVTFNAARSRVQAFGMFPMNLNGAWTAGPAYLIGPGNTDFIIIPLDFHDNATITFVTMYFAVTSSRSLLPATLPGYAILRRKIVDGTFAGFLSTGTTFCGASTAAGYYDGGVVQGISCTPDQNNVIDKSTYAYYAFVTDENGTNALNDNQFMGIVATASNIPDLRFQ